MTPEKFNQKYTSKLNEQQQEAVRAIDGAVLLLAVPGSGKTTVLVTRLGYMVCCANITPGSILTMTYTVAATEGIENLDVGVEKMPQIYQQCCSELKQQRLMDYDDQMYYALTILNSFGHGTIVAITDYIADAKFDKSNKVKRLMLSACFDKGLLKLRL